MLLHSTKPERNTSNAEDGYLLLTVLVMVFLLLLALSVAAPKVAKEIQRDKEQEAVQRGLQYRRAIQLYYKKFGAYPGDIKQLEKTNEIRFLRKRYKDPITGQDDWRLIHIGEAKVPPMGMFGQPLQTGLSSVSTGPGMGISGTPGIYASSGNGDTSGNNTGTNGGANGPANGAAAGTATNPTNSGSSSFGFSNSNSNNGPSGIGNSGIGNSGIGPSGSSFGFNSNTGASNAGGGIGGTPTGTNGPGASSNGGGTTFGSGGLIVGVGIPVKKNSLLEYHKQKKYSDWEFVYDPQTDLLRQLRIEWHPWLWLWVWEFRELGAAPEQRSWLERAEQRTWFERAK
jgi:type II secretory pathway pseudopilin PulG